MEFFDFGEFQINGQMPSHDKIIFHLHQPKTIPSVKRIALIIPYSKPDAILEPNCTRGQVRDQISIEFTDVDICTRKFGKTWLKSEIQLSFSVSILT